MHSIQGQPIVDKKENIVNDSDWEFELELFSPKEKKRKKKENQMK